MGVNTRAIIAAIITQIREWPCQNDFVILLILTPAETQLAASCARAVTGTVTNNILN